VETTVPETARAFDSHAAHYDVLVEQNALLQNMRSALWSQVTHRASPPARVLDIGCGTGIDAAYFASRGYHVTAIDASREMVNHTRSRLHSMGAHARVENIGAQELDYLGGETYDVIYSDLGPLNCVPDLQTVSRLCANRLTHNGFLVLSVMARSCPWEILFFTFRGEFEQATRRFPKQMVPVPMGNGVVWTRYYSPTDFYRYFAREFRLVSYRSLNLFLPPPYLERWYHRAGALAGPLNWLDARTNALPLLRDMGDHFLMVLAPTRTVTAEIGRRRAP
jgi:2-polyprenyl-3-methyl-5-hydroxy-6-metoxy-1,4-benzoquinol methylase